MVVSRIVFGRDRTGFAFVSESRLLAVHMAWFYWPTSDLKQCEANWTFGYSFPQAVLRKACEQEDLEFCKNLQPTHKSKIPVNAQIFFSHTVDRLNLNDEESLKLKGRISTHRNEDNIKGDLRSDFCMCLPYGEIIILSVSALRGWRISKYDRKAAL